MDEGLSHLWIDSTALMLHYADRFASVVIDTALKPPLDNELNKQGRAELV
jgi:hypothetical protein